MQVESCITEVDGNRRAATLGKSSESVDISEHFRVVAVGVHFS